MKRGTIAPMSSLKDTYWPDMTTAVVAQNSIERAAVTAYVVSGLTALVALLAWFDVFHLLSPWSLIDAVLFALIGLFISRRSRVAALIGLAFYLLEVTDRILSGTGGSTGGFSVLAVLFTLFFINGVRGSFALARFQRPPEAVDNVG
jgi:hypothetical protein